MWQNPASVPGIHMSQKEIQQNFDAFYEDVYCEACKFGKVDKIIVSENSNDRKYSILFE
jgi:splicing factor U2AF subunit